jgi:hypothetical protein
VGICAALQRGPGKRRQREAGASFTFNPRPSLPTPTLGAVPGDRRQRGAGPSQLLSGDSECRPAGVRANTGGVTRVSDRSVIRSRASSRCSRPRHCQGTLRRSFAALAERSHRIVRLGVEAPHAALGAPDDRRVPTE